MDLATISVLSNASENNLELASLLVSLQHHRNQALHTGREWSELTAHKCIKNIKACSDHLNKLHFCFADIFGESALYQAGIPTKKAA